MRLARRRGVGSVTPAPLIGGTGWKYVFGDGFDNGLDTTRWATHYDRAGNLAYSNPSNGEAQWYLPANVTVSGGALHLTAKSETSNGFSYTSGMVTSKPSFNFTYGYVECRFKVPPGSGFWPAVWTWRNDENWIGEQDLMEFYGDNLARIYITYHASSGNSGTFVTNADWSSTWHTVGMDWRPDATDFYADNVLAVTTASIDQPMYLLLNLAISNGVNAPAPTVGTVFPSNYDVDYIRVWQH